jgi:hypothetical protein
MDAMTLEQIVGKRQEYLAELRKRQCILRVRAVAKGYATGLYLHGRPA